MVEEEAEVVVVGQEALVAEEVAEALVRALPHHPIPREQPERKAPPRGPA